MNSDGAINWTVGKLLTIILLVIVMALVLWGWNTGKMGPLFDRVTTMADGMMNTIYDIMGRDVSKGSEGGCYAAEIDLKVGDPPIAAKFCYDDDGCSIVGLSNLGFDRDAFYLVDGKFIYLLDGGVHASADYYLLQDPSKNEREWEVYNLLIEKLGVISEEDLSGEGFLNWVSSIFDAKPPLLLFRIDGQGQDWYILWDEGKWYDAAVPYNRVIHHGRETRWEDGAALDEIYEHSSDTWPNPDDYVYYRLGLHGAEKLIPGMEYEGEIISKDDREIFGRWFRDKKEELISSSLPDENLVKDLMQKISEEDLEIEYQGNYPIFVLKDTGGRYGLMHDLHRGELAEEHRKKYPLRLVEYSDTQGQWVSVSTPDHILRLPRSEFDFRMKVTAIYKFLKSRC
jgi:hypothetical protein